MNSGIGALRVRVLFDFSKAAFSRYVYGIVTLCESLFSCVFHECDARSGLCLLMVMSVFCFLLARER